VAEVTTWPGVVGVVGVPVSQPVTAKPKNTSKITLIRFITNDHLNLSTRLF
jgi:hypothetical protein